MVWIKRNLYFLIGSVVALALMGLAGWYLYSQWTLNNTILEGLNAKYADLDRLNNLNPNPGEKGPGKVDNVEAAQHQEQELRAFNLKTRPHFERIPRIPDQPNVSESDFAREVAVTLNRMQHEASNANVALPKPDYGFSFEAERSLMRFGVGLDALSVQLGEVKAISEVLLQARINALEGLRRERVSEDDSKGPPTDYLEERSTTNQLAVLTPYEVSFRCFTPELASVLAGFAGSPHGMIVKTINVELAPATPEEAPGAAAGAITPAIRPPVIYTPPVRRLTPEEEFARRYGQPSTPTPRPVPPPSYLPAPVAAPAPGKGGLPTVLDEKQLKITMLVNIVKLAAPKAK